MGVLLMHSLVISLCDGKFDVLHFAVTRCEMMNHFISVYSLSDGGRFLCIVRLRGHWVLANLFLLHQ